MTVSGELALLGAFACATAFAGGAGFGRAWCQRARQGFLYRQAYLREEGLGKDSRFAEGLGGVGLRVAAMASMRCGGKGALWTRLLPKTASWFQESAGKAAISPLVTPAGACLARVACLVLGAATGASTGLPFSFELAACFAAIGALLGWRLLPTAVERRRRERARDAERCLPHMLEVMAMGLRSGLSLERSMQAYASHFDTSLARSCELAIQRWNTGLRERDQALRELGESYDSVLVKRAVEGVIRSARLGSSLADDLASIAAQARSSYVSQRQERAAKAPVKMMVSTGTLMLPAMLLLVLGPILLELMSGV